MRPSQSFARERPDALFVGGDPFFHSRRLQLALPGGAAGGARVVFHRATIPNTVG